AALVSAISECSAFLWTRALKADAGAAATVGKEAAKEVDRLWHFYVQNGGSAEAMAGPIVQLFRKIESLSDKYDGEMLTSVWAQASWFALRRVSGEATGPIVALVAQVAHLDPTAHARLADGGRMLLEAFCQLAVQTPDAAAAHALIGALAKRAPEAVFGGAHADAFAKRLAGAGAPDDAVALALARARFVLDSTGSGAEAARSIDAFAAPLLRADDGSDETATRLLAALQGSDLARSGRWTAEARLPGVDAALLALVARLPVRLAADAPRAATVELLGRALGLFFAEGRLLDSATGSALFGWMAQVFVEVCSAQPVDGGSAWEAACGEVLRAWAGLARAGESGRRFVDYWLQQSGAGRAALGLLLDYAESPAEDAGSEWRLARQAHHTWAAVEARLGEVGRGAELARALGEAIAQDVDDVRAKRGPGQLARLASGVYGRICPQSDEATLRALVAMWLLDGARRAGPDEQTARAAAVAGGAGLWQAVEDAAASAGPDASFHSAAHWLAATSAGPEAAPVALDAGGRARAARWAIFGIEFVRRAGGLCVLAGAGQAAVADFVLRMALAFVLLREALLLASSNAEWSAAEAGSGDGRMVAQAAIVSSGSASAEVLAQADRAARAIQDAVSDLLALVAVYDQPLPARGTQSGRLGAGAPPDAGRWLGRLMEHVLGEPSKAAPDSVWDCVVERL
ncbi:hypothetical protein IWQ56_004630, partial [Coemansia nantahalensis]